MNLLRPLLLAVLGAFAAAAPAAPVAVGDHEGGHRYTTELNVAQRDEQGHVPPAAVAGVAAATPDRATPDVSGPAPVLPPCDSQGPRLDAAAPAATLPVSPRERAPRGADLRAGLLDLPPPALRTA